MEDESPHAVQLVEIKQESNHIYKLNTASLEKILLNPKVADKKVAVIGVAGAYRKGKSFLLNFFLRYLTWKSRGTADGLKDSEWMSAQSQHSGFSWKGGSNPDTKGILMWNEPFVMKNMFGEETVVLLMDTQGSFDSNSSDRDNATIFALSTMVSSVQVYNLSQNIQENDLQNLQFFTEYGRMAANEKATQKQFQSLIFLIRDWQYPTEAEYGFDGGKQTLENRMKVSSTHQEAQRELRKHIKDCFEDISCCLMPHPGKKVAQMVKGELEDDDMDDEFKDTLNILVPRLLNPNKLVRKKINGSEITCRGLMEYFKSYMNQFNGNELPEPKSVFLATAEANNLAAVATSRAVYQSEMEERCGGSTPFMSSSELSAIHRKCKKSAVQSFLKTKKMGADEYKLKFFEKLEDELEDLYSIFERANDGKSTSGIFMSVFMILLTIVLIVAIWLKSRNIQASVISTIALIASCWFYLSYDKIKVYLRDLKSWIYFAIIARFLDIFLGARNYVAFRRN